MRFITKDTLRIVNGLFIFLTIFQILFDLANGLTLGEIISVKYIAIKLVVAIVLAIVFAGVYKLFSNLTEKIKFLEEKQVVKPSDENPNDLVVVAKFHDHVYKGTSGWISNKPDSGQNSNEPSDFRTAFRRRLYPELISSLMLPGVFIPLKKRDKKHQSQRKSITLLHTL